MDNISNGNIVPAFVGYEQNTTCINYQRYKKCETKSGHIYLVQKLNSNIYRLPVQLSAYRNGYGHYAVISADKTFTNKSVHISLKNCIVKQTGTCQITVIADNADGATMMFQTPNEQETDQWMDILQNESALNGNQPNFKLNESYVEYSKSTTNGQVENRRPLSLSRQLSIVSEFMEDDDEYMEEDDEDAISSNDIDNNRIH